MKNSPEIFPSNDTPKPIDNERLLRFGARFLVASELLGGLGRSVISNFWTNDDYSILENFARAAPTSVTLSIACPLAARLLSHQKVNGYTVVAIGFGSVACLVIAATGETIVESYLKQQKELYKNQHTLDKAPVSLLDQTAEDIIAIHPNTVTYHQALATLAPR